MSLFFLGLYHVDRALLYRLTAEDALVEWSQAIGFLLSSIGFTLLATTGIHRRRLDRFVTALDEELRGGRGGAYRVRDHYIARVFDVLEMLRAATKAFS